MFFSTFASTSLAGSSSSFGSKYTNFVSVPPTSTPIAGTKLREREVELNFNGMRYLKMTYFGMNQMEFSKPTKKCQQKCYYKNSFKRWI